MAKEKHFRDGKRARKRSQRLIPREKETVTKKEVSSEKKRSKRVKRERRRTSFFGGFPSAFNWGEWNRSRTSGIDAEELSPTISQHEEQGFFIEEINLDVDEERIEAVKKEKRDKSLKNILLRSEL
jgi:hypothetical protein